MSSVQNNRGNHTSYNFFTVDNTPHNQQFPISSFTEIDNDPIYFMASQIKRQVIKSAQKTKGLRQLNSRSFKKKKEEEADTDFSLSLPQNKTVLENYSCSESINKDKSRLLQSIQNQKKLLNKVTIHRIRSQRQNFQAQTKRLENSYNYLLHQAQKNKKKSLQKAQKLERIKHIQQQSKKEKHFIQTQRTLFIRQNLSQKSRLRQAVLSQKKHKQKKVVEFYNSLHENASRIRFQSNKIDEEILKSQIGEIQQKKIKYLTEKKSEKKRLLNRQRNLQNKMVMAQNQFKMKWLKEFNESSEARKKYMQKRQVLSRKMHKLYEKMSIQNTIYLNQVTRNKSQIKIKSNLNPEE